MLKQIKLTHYRQHVDRTVEFKPGINAIRGAVEAGKSTVMEAWLYLFFGTKALAEPLEDVVTYDTPISKLKVEGTFSYLGVDYEAYRGKSGAEVSFGREKITGQTEVTKFFESLFKCGAAMAAKLMVAEQVKLRGALEDGPKAAGEMIEYLADFDLLDRVIELVQTNLPVGATAGVESRIALLSAQAVEVEAVDVLPLENVVVAAQGTLAGARESLQNLSAELDQLDVVAASHILADEARLSAAIGVRSGKILELKAQVSEPLPAAPAEGEIEAMRAKVSAQRDLEAAARVHANLKAATPEVLWDEPRAALDAAVEAEQSRLVSAEKEVLRLMELQAATERADQQQISDFRVQITKLQGRLIQENTCAFCQKDLSDVPEVVKQNSSVTAEIAEVQKKLDDYLDGCNTWTTQIQEDLAAQRRIAINSSLSDLQAVVKADDLWDKLLATAGDNISIDRSVVPARWTWIGPTDEAQDFAGDLAKLVAADKAATAAAAARVEQEKRLAEMAEQQATDISAVKALPLQDAKETIDLAEDLKPKVAAARALVEEAADAMHKAEGALAVAKLSNEQGVKAAASAKAQLALAQEELDAMLANNVLINKVRKARPVITNKLWNLTLGATSKYFTDVRGIPSVITRDGVFKCNGKPVAGLSGSAKDSLGLAMRVSLVKTFLPNIPFMMLDEPAAACNAERETNMLGLLSTIGFDQVILITHSDLADAYADNVIRL